MSRKTVNMTDDVHAYLLSVSLREHKVLQQAREDATRHPHSDLQIAPEQGQFMNLLLKIMQARNVIEVGVFTGYSSLAMALALPPDGRVIACDVSEEYTRTAREYWEQAGVSDKIELRLAPALDTLAALLDAGEAGKYDFIFLDAIKEEYLEYYQLGLQLLRSGGVIAADNVLWDGKVADPDDQRPDTLALRKFNEYLHRDERVDISILPLGDGLTLARKR